MKKCHKCGAVIDIEKVGRRDECRVCGSDLRVCLNCALYDINRANQCFEPQAEKVKEKDRSNYCDFFQFKEAGQQKAGREDAEKLWKDLFRKDKS